MQEPTRVRMDGPPAPHAPGFARYLEDRGYATKTICEHLRLVMALSRALDAARVGIEGLGVGQMAALARTERRSVSRSGRMFRPFASYLESLRAGPVEEPIDPLGAFLMRYQHYLVGERSLAPLTVEGYMKTAREFLASRCAGDPERVTQLGAGDVSGFVLSLGERGLSPRTVNDNVVELRSLLRFLYVKDMTHSPLANAAPWLAHSRANALPRSLEAGVAARLLQSCDRATLVGARDFAVICVLTRLCLRAGEVAALCLEDLDWRRGEVVIHGKGGRTDRLPLPVDVGEALADYLSHRRPEVDCRQVFLHVRAPRDGLGRTDVRAAVRRACWRAGLDDVGTHRFRHAGATQMLAQGAPLHEIAELLRHGVSQTTAIYAKVDFAALASVACPWPEIPA